MVEYRIVGGVELPNCILDLGGLSPWQTLSDVACRCSLDFDAIRWAGIRIVRPVAYNLRDMYLASVLLRH